MSLPDKTTVLNKVKEEFEEIIIAHIQDTEDKEARFEDEEDVREACGEFIESLIDDLIEVVDNTFSNICP